jgi:hypothetical protein
VNVRPDKDMTLNDTSVRYGYHPDIYKPAGGLYIRVALPAIVKEHRSLMEFARRIAAVILIMCGRRRK